MTTDTVPTTVLRRNPAIEEAPLNDELMLFNPNTAQFYVLNRTMAFTWKRLETTKSLEELTVAIAGHFAGVTPEAAAADLRNSVEQLISHGLIEASA